jgi:signal transduction histidine kinase
MNNYFYGSVLNVFVLGAIILAFLYHLILYYFSKDKIIIYYLLYLFFTGIFAFEFSGLLNFFFDQQIENFYYENFKECTQIFYLAFYFNFILQSIEVGKVKSGFLYWSWVTIMAILIGYGIVFSVLKLIFHFQHYSFAFITIRVFIFIMTAFMLWRCYKLRNLTFQRYILYGCSIYFIFGIISFVTHAFETKNMSISPPEWLVLGSFVDVFFFSIAISYRNKRQWEDLNLALLNDANELIKLQNLVLEKQNALENERARIAADMHDDLGSGLTTITYLSQMAKGDLTAVNLDKIKRTSTNLIENMSDIIWAMKEENNTIEDLISHIKRYAVDYLENNKISLSNSISHFDEKIIVNGEIRRFLFLCVKEALHNIVKHSQATKVTIEIEINDQLSISIQDNGIGFDTKIEKPNSGNGLKNMKKRIEKINGSLYIIADTGTLTVFSIPIKKLMV